MFLPTPGSRQVNQLQERAIPSRRQGDILQEEEEEIFLPVDILQMTGNPSANRCDIPGKSSESTDEAHAHAAQHTKQNDFEAKNVNLPTKNSVPNEATDSTEATYFLNCHYTNANRLINKLEELHVIVDISQKLLAKQRHGMMIPSWTARKPLMDILFSERIKSLP